MSENPSGHNGSNSQNSPYGNNYDPSGNSSGSYGQGNYGQGNYGQGDYGSQYSQADFGSDYGQDGQQSVGSQGSYADYQQPVGSQGDYGSQYSQADFGSSYGQDAQQPVGSQGGYADYQQDPQAYGGSDLYGAGGPGGPGGPSSTEKNSLGVISLVSGIVGFFIWLVGIVAIITGFMSLKAVKNGQANNKGVGLTGLILGFFTTVVGLIVTVIVVIFVVIGIGSANPAPAPADPGSGTEAPADPEGDGDPGESDDKGEAAGDGAAEGGDINAGSDKATLIGTYEGIEIRAYITSGKPDEYSIPNAFAGREVLVIKYFLKNTNDKDAKIGAARINCIANGQDCSKNVHGKIGDRNLDVPTLDLGAKPIKAGKEHEFVTAQAIEYDRAGDAEISISIMSKDWSDEEEFKIK